MLDLYVCLRPVRWFKGVPSPVKNPGKVDMVIFRENTEDIYAGIEWEAGSEQAKKMLAFLEREFPSEYRKIRFPGSSRPRLEAGLARGDRAAGPRRASSTPSSTSARASPWCTRATS